MIDIADAPATASFPYAATSASSPASTAEKSRWPGGEARISLLETKQEEGNHFGLGGLLAPHISPSGIKFNSWASTVDYRLLLPAHLQ